MDIRWYLNRLKRMSSAEIVHRSKQVSMSNLQKFGLFTAKTVQIANQNDCFSISFGKIDVDHTIYIRKASAILEGRLDVFALKENNIGTPPDWNRDPLTGTIAPKTFGKTLNYRDQKIVGNIKYLWEPSRHLHVVTLAQAYYLTHDIKYFDGIRAHLESWFKQCPYLQGANWVSSLELAIRLINWSLAWQIIGGRRSKVWDIDDNAQFREQWLNSIYQHCHFIYGHFSRYSSANNHLIGEAAGLFIGSVTWPNWSKSKTWQNKAHSILIEEALKQNAPDGVNLEQTTSYQQFVLDFLIISAVIGKNNDIKFPTEYWQCINNMLDFLVAITDISGNVPMIGDADDGYVVRLSQEKEFCPYKSLITTGSVLRSAPVYSSIDDKTQWLLGAAASKRTLQNTDSMQKHRKRVFDIGGYYVLGDKFGEPAELLIVMDIAPLGYKSIAAHGHADALSFTLNLAGCEFFVDPGTFSYHTQEKWRNYFRGTSAHNTIRVDQCDQSIIGGSFMWMQHASVKVEAQSFSDEEDNIIGVHDGYMRLDDPVTHKRQLILDKENKVLTIVDTLTCNDTHTIEQFWHLSEYLFIELSGHHASINNKNYSIVMELDSNFEKVTLIKGDEQLPLGWISRNFDVKTPTYTIKCTSTIRETTSYITTVHY